jgi:integrase/recombinase XerC
MLEEKITDFLQYLRFEKRYSPNTVLAYHNDLLQFKDFIATEFSLDDVANITHFHIRSWLVTFKDDKRTAKTINRKVSGVSSFFKHLLRQGLVEKNPVRQMHAIRLPERLPSYLKETETEHLLEEQNFGEGFKGTTDRLICELLYQTGMRRNELLQMKEIDVEWSLKQVRILGKGNKERLVPVGPALIDSLKDYLSMKKDIEGCDQDHLLVLENGKPLYAGYIYRVVKQRLTDTGSTLSKKSPHVLRHTFATQLLNNGANIQAIKDLLGHSSLAATQVYTHNNIDKLKEIHKLNHPKG